MIRTTIFSGSSYLQREIPGEENSVEMDIAIGLHRMNALNAQIQDTTEESSGILIIFLVCSTLIGIAGYCCAIKWKYCKPKVQKKTIVTVW